MPNLSDHPTGVFDVVIDAVGYAGTRRTASVMARPGGVIAHIGLGDALDGLDVRRMTLQEITFVEPIPIRPLISATQRKPYLTANLAISLGWSTANLTTGLWRSKTCKKVLSKPRRLC